MASLEKSALDRAHVAFVLGAGQVGIGAVGVDDAAFAVGDDDPLAHRIDERPRHVGALAAGAEADEADGAGEEREDADDGEQPENGEHEGLCSIRADQREADRDADQRAGDDDQAAGAGHPPGVVDDRGGSDRFLGAIGHQGGKPPSVQGSSAPAESGSPPTAAGWLGKCRNSM